MSNAPEQTSSGSGAKTVLIILFVIVALIIGVCACGAGALYFGWGKMEQMAGEEFKKELIGNSVLEEEIGEDFTLSMDLMETARRAEENPGEERIAFQIEGDKGSGVLLIKPGRGQNTIDSAQLEMKDGRMIDVPLENSLDPGDIDLGGFEEGSPLIPEEGGAEGGEEASGTEADGASDDAAADAPAL